MREAIPRRKLTDSRNLPTASALGASPRKPEVPAGILLFRVDQDSDPDLLRCVTRAPVGRFSARGFESGTHRGGSNLPAKKQKAASAGAQRRTLTRGKSKLSSDPAAERAGPENAATGKKAEAPSP